MSMQQVDTVENRTNYRNIAMTRTAGGGGSLVMSTFGEVVAFAELMARSQHAIPAHLRGNPGACMAVTMLAMRLEMDPFALASKSYVTKEGATIAYEAQMFAAIINTRAPIKRKPDYAFQGEGDNLKCTVTCEMLDGSIKDYESPTLGRILVKNSPLWKGDPQQQIGYYSIRAWARRHCPEVVLGIYDVEEIEQRAAPAIGPDKAIDVSPPRRSMVESLDRLAAKPARTDDTPSEQSAVTDPANEASATGPTAASQEAGQTAPTAEEQPDDAGAAGDQAPASESESDPAKAALMDKLRLAASKGGAALRRKFGGLSETEQAMLDSEDNPPLWAIADTVDKQGAAA